MPAEICAGFERLLARAGRRFGLTPRELQTLALLVSGATWKRAAGEMGISDRTVQFHAFNLRRKIGAENLAVAVVKIFSR